MCISGEKTKQKKKSKKAKFSAVLSIYKSM